MSDELRASSRPHVTLQPGHSPFRPYDDPADNVARSHISPYDRTGTPPRGDATPGDVNVPADAPAYFEGEGSKDADGAHTPLASPTGAGSGTATNDETTPHPHADPDRTVTLPLSSIDPVPPLKSRYFYSQAAAAEMMESLRREGMIHPIVVRKRSDGTYQLVVGGCRLMAAGRLRWEEVICTVRDLTDSEAERMILAENERRSDTSTLDKAYSLGEVVKNMKDRGERVTRDRLAEKLPYAQGTVSYLLKISERVRPEFLRLAGVEHRDAAQLPQAALLRVADEMNLGVQINRLKAELARLEGDVSEPDRSESAGKLPKDRVTAPDLTSPPFQVRIHNDGTCSFRIDSEGVANADEAVKEAARRRIAPFLRAMGFRLSESDA